MRHAANRISLGEVVTPLVELERPDAGGGFSHGEGRGPASYRLVQGEGPRARGVDGEGARTRPSRHADQRQCGGGPCRLRVRAPGSNRSCSVRTTPRKSTFRRSSCRERSPGGWTASSTTAGASSGSERTRKPGSTCRPSRSPIASKARRRWDLELAEQLGWNLPDVILYPTGGGTGLIGMWKAFAELRAVGWLEGKLPRMVAVQADGCAPIVRAYDAGEEHAPRWEGASTVAAGIRGSGRDRRLPHPARGSRERRLCGERERRGDCRSAAGGGPPRRAAALPGGSGNLRRMAGGRLRTAGLGSANGSCCSTARRA